jgi:VWFA-related protein
VTLPAQWRKNLVQTGWLLVLSCCFLPPDLSAQQAPDQPQTKPDAASAVAVPETTFRSRSELVLVPVVVRDKHGKHISGLTKEAFRLEEKGKEQTISLFEEIQTGIEDAPSQILDRGYSNLPYDNSQHLRLTIMVLDLLNTSPLQRTDGREQLTTFLAKGLARNQPVSLLCLTSKGLQLVHPFSSDTGVLINSLRDLSLGPPRVAPGRNIVDSTLKQLREIAQAYTGIPGRKTMLFAAGDIPEPQLDGDSYHGIRSTVDTFQQTWKALSDANISVYPVELLVAALDPAYPTNRERSYQRTLRQFAAATGGNLCLEAHEITDCLAEAVEDSRSYYMLGFSVRPDDRKPGWRDLKVQVSGEQGNIRARDGFYYRESPAPGPKTAHDAEMNALASVLAYSALPMYVRVLPPAAAPTARAASAPAKTSVEFLVTIPLSSIRIDPANANSLDLEIGAIALNRDSREAGEFLHPVRGSPKPDVLRAFARDGIKLKEKLELPPGTYDIRFMARDNTAGQIGTVVFPLELK